VPQQQFHAIAAGEVSGPGKTISSIAAADPE
jgi:hypothetical protein